MNWEAAIASIALVVSIGTALFTYHVDQKTQHRQRLFEVSVVKIQALDSAKRTVSRISSNINRALNALVLSGGHNTGPDPNTGKDPIETIFASYRQAVDEFNATKHNLDKARADAFEKMITDYEEIMFASMNAGETPTATQIQNLATIPGELEVLIDDAIKNLQTEMASE